MRLFSYHGKHEKKKATRLPLSAYLSYLLVATLMFTGVSFSKFTTTASGWDSARVAKFSVSTATVNNQKTELDLDLSTTTGTKTDYYSFIIKNDSDVRATYTVMVDLKTALPTGVSMTMIMSTGDGEESTIMTPDVSNHVHTYQSELDFTDVHQWTLTFSSNPAEVAEEVLLTDIIVTVTAEQVG